MLGSLKEKIAHLVDGQLTNEQIDELIDGAVATGGVHVIKFVEACLREYRLNPKPVYLVAARDVRKRIGA